MEIGVHQLLPLPAPWVHAVPRNAVTRTSPPPEAAQCKFGRCQRQRPASRRERGATPLRTDCEADVDPNLDPDPRCCIVQIECTLRPALHCDGVWDGTMQPPALTLQLLKSWYFGGGFSFGCLTFTMVIADRVPSWSGSGTGLRRDGRPKQRMPTSASSAYGYGRVAAWVVGI